MVAKTIAQLRADMPVNVQSAISAQDVNNFIDTAEALSAGVTPKQHGAVGDGIVDDTAAINAALATGKDVILSSGTYRVTNKLIMNTPKQKFMGAGGIIQIRGNTMKTTTCLEVSGEGCTVQGLRLENPDLLMDRLTPFGNASCIRVHANYVRIIDNTVVSWLDGIKVDQQGEFYGIIISGNFCLEMLGAGTGENDPDLNQEGEDRGDGITCFGALATIVNNFVQLKDGQDGRIGIHAESLKTFPFTHPKYEGRLVTITGNVIVGKYRRGIISEEVVNLTISGNVIAGVSWWGIGSLNAENTVISNNAILFDRPATDNSGASWGVDQSGITVYCHQVGYSTGIVISGNSIQVSGVGYGIVGIGGIDVNARKKDISVTGNTIIGNAASKGGIRFNNTDRISVTGNMVNTTGAEGIILFDCTAVTVTGNSVFNAATKGIDISKFSFDVKSGSISNNIVRDGTDGIHVFGATGLSVMGNTIESTSGNALTISSVDNSIVSYNIFRDTTGQLVTFDLGTGNIIGNNISFTTPP